MSVKDPSIPSFIPRENKRQLVGNLYVNNLHNVFSNHLLPIQPWSTRGQRKIGIVTLRKKLNPLNTSVFCTKLSESNMVKHGFITQLNWRLIPPWDRCTVPPNFKILPFLYFSFVPVITYFTNRKLSFVLNRSDCHLTFITLFQLLTIDHKLSRLTARELTINNHQQLNKNVKNKKPFKLKFHELIWVNCMHMPIYHVMFYNTNANFYKIENITWATINCCNWKTYCHERCTWVWLSNK